VEEPDLYDGLDAERGREIGLVDEVVKPGELRVHVQAYAATLATKPPEAVTGIRRSRAVATRRVGRSTTALAKRRASRCWACGLVMTYAG